MNATPVVTRGGFKQISCGQNGIFALSMNGGIFERTGVQNSNPQGMNWNGLGNFLLRQISSGNFGVLWGISFNSSAVFLQGEKWIFGDETCTWVSCGGYGC